MFRLTNSEWNTLMASLALLSLFGMARQAHALNAGDRVTTDVVLDRDLVTNANSGLVVGADNITIDGNGYSLACLVQSRFAGKRIDIGSYRNVTIKNFRKISGFFFGIEASGGGAITIDNCRVESNYLAGIQFVNVAGVRVTGCTLREDNSGFSIGSCSGVILSGNTVFGGRAGLFISQGTGTEVFSNNTFLHQLNDHSYPPTLRRMLKYSSIRRRANVGEPVDFSLALSALNGGQASGSVCTIRTVPHEPIAYNRSGDTLSGSFSPSRNGLYSVVAQVTDPDGNTSMRCAKAFVGPLASREVTYYMYGRGAGPFHGQGIPGMNDIAGMNLVPPPIPSEFHCGLWVNWYPDTLPATPTALLQSVEVKALLKFDGTQGTNPEIGIQRVGGSGAPPDVKTGLPLAWGTNQVVWGETSLAGLGWLLDYPQDWYFLSMEARADSIMIYTGDPQAWGHPASRLSRTIFHYDVPASPEVRSVSNTRLLVLGAAADPVGVGRESIAVWGWGDQAELVLANFRRPFLEVDVEISAAAEARFNTGSVNGERTFSAIPLDVFPTQDAVRVTVTAWPVTPNGNRQWTEIAVGAPGAVQHTLGGLSPLTTYRITANGSQLLAGNSDSQGRLSFSYGGSFPVTFVTTLAKAKNLGDANGDGKADVLFRHPSKGDVMLWIMH